MNTVHQWYEVQENVLQIKHTWNQLIQAPFDGINVGLFLIVDASGMLKD